MKGNKKPLYVLGAFLLIFSFFVYLMTRDSKEMSAIKELRSLTNLAAVEANWASHIELQSKPKYVAAIRAKINSFKPDKKEVESIQSWLPPATDNLNVIIVPDLSWRTDNSENQTRNDTALIHQVWSSFQESTKKGNSKGRLLIDITDNCQPVTKTYMTFADSLIFDLAKSKGLNKRKHLQEKKKQFERNLLALYPGSTNKLPVADYVYYFSQILPSRLKKSTLEDRYRNIVILLTDGYLESDYCGTQSVKQITPFTNEEFRAKFHNPSPSNLTLPTQTADLALSGVEVYMFEIHEREGNQGVHRKVLKDWWTNWFKSMKVSNIEEDFFFKREDAIQLTKDRVQQIFTN